ncbi:flavin reductase family protein [Cereibacter sediminicola]|uniref:flavin reductase family protein n=1 Tax=Cereibacter sediminicola TaxID=2584941 RepID=UPI0011A22949|nr:flavin reductase family protein [Cereibacter sediminicola]
MFYRPEDGHGLPHNPFNAIVAPRPIGWISTRGPTGDNLAPYSFFNAVAYVPPQVMFASTSTKDSLAALRESGVFCVNIVEEAALSRMNATSAAFPRGTDEFLEAGVDKAECRTIDCPRVGDGPASLECRVTQVVDLLGRDNHLVLGEVTGVHLRDDCLRDGRFDVTTFRPMARLGYRDYAVIREVIELSRPPGG